MVGCLSLREMRLVEGVYIYAWVHPQYNNANSYLLVDEAVVLVDPGHLNFIPELLNQIRRDGFSGKDIGVILCTHLHPDHFEGVEFFKTSLLGYHQREEEALRDFYASYLYQPSGAKVPSKEADFYLREGELWIGKGLWRVIHTPGHSPGSVCLYNPDKKVLITGDVVFYQGVGRTDLMGDPHALASSIRALMKLDVEYLLPGHGQILVGSESIKRNFHLIERMVLPFLL